MTLYKLQKITNGKTITDSIDTLPVINQRKKTLLSSYRGKNVKIVIVKADENEEKFRIKPKDGRMYS